MLKNKKIILALSTALLLVGCSPKIEDNSIKATPDWANESLDDKDTEKLSEIYEKLLDSDTANTYIMEDIYKDLFNNIHGSYFDYVDSEGTHEGIRSLAKKANLNLKDSDVAKFTSEHSYYDLKDDKYFQGKWGESQEEKTLSPDSEEVKVLKAQKLIDLNDYIEKRILDALYNDLGPTSDSSAYKNNDGYYEEYLFVRHLVNEMYKVPSECFNGDNTFDSSKLKEMMFKGGHNGLIDEDSDGNPDILAPEDEEKIKIVFNPDIVKPENYFGTYFTTISGKDDFYIYEDYIKRNILKTIQKDLLTEFYIYKTKYDTLGRNYSRKLTYMTLTHDGECTKFVRKLVKNFAKKYIGEEDESKGYENEEIPYEILSIAYKGIGINGTPATESFYEKAKELITGDGTSEIEDLTLDNELGVEITFNGFSGGSRKVYKNTEVYEEAYKPILDILDYDDKKKGEGSETAPIFDITKLKDGNSIDMEALNKCTDSLTKTIEEVVDQKIKGITSEKLVYRNEWFNKGDSVGGIAATTTDELFSIKVASSEFDSEDRLKPDYKYDYKEKTRLLKNGHTFLVNNKTETGEAEDYNYILPVTGAADSFIEIHEAVSTTKLRNDSDKSYKHIKGTTVTDLSTVENQKAFAKDVLGQENIARAISEKLKTNSDYDKKSKEFFITILGIAFHDEKFYTYMKNTYPDLFV